MRVAPHRPCPLLQPVRHPITFLEPRVGCPSAIVHPSLRGSGLTKNHGRWPPSPANQQVHTCALTHLRVPVSMQVRTCPSTARPQVSNRPKTHLHNSLSLQL